MNRRSTVLVFFLAVILITVASFITYTRFFESKTEDSVSVTANDDVASGDVASGDVALIEQNEQSELAQVEVNESLAFSEETEEITRKNILFIASDGFTISRPSFSGILNDVDVINRLSISNSASDGKAVFTDAQVYIESADGINTLYVMDSLTQNIVCQMLSPIPCPQYSWAFYDDEGNPFFICKGIDGTHYIWSFNFNSVVTDDVEENTPDDELKLNERIIADTYLQNNLDFSSLIQPSVATVSTITDKLSNWQQGSFDGQLPEAEQFVFGSYMPFTNLAIFVLVPEEQGNHTLGVCDENGLWSTSRQFAAVFTDSGEMRSVSLDYVADKPQVTLYLSDNEVYYAVVGSLGGFLDDSTSYFTVRKAN